MTMIDKLQSGAVFIGTSEVLDEAQILVMLKSRPFGDQMIIEATVGVKPDRERRIDWRVSMLFDTPSYIYAVDKESMAHTVMQSLYRDMVEQIKVRMNAIYIRLFEEAWKGLQEMPTEKEILQLREWTAKEER
jgi:hypothetical protein